MLVEKNLKEALEYYIKGKPVTALWIGEDGRIRMLMHGSLVTEQLVLQKRKTIRKLQFMLTLLQHKE